SLSSSPYIPCKTPRGALPARNPFIRTRRRSSSYARENPLVTVSAGNSTRTLRCTGLISSTSIFIIHHRERESRCRDNRPTFNPSSNLIDYLRFWCERGDSNPHGCPLDPKSFLCSRMVVCLPTKPNYFKKCAAIFLVIVGLCMRTVSDKSRTMRAFTYHNGRV